MQSVAGAYKKKYSDVEDGDQEVFFLRLDYESSPRIFGKYDVTSVPLVFHIGPDFGSDVDDSDLLEDGEDDGVEERSS